MRLVEPGNENDLYITTIFAKESIQRKHKQRMLTEKTGQCDDLPTHRGTPLLHGSVRMDSRKALCHHSKSHRQCECAHVARSVSERHMSAVVSALLYCCSPCTASSSALPPGESLSNSSQTQWGRKRERGRGLTRGGGRRGYHSTTRRTRDYRPHRRALVIRLGNHTDAATGAQSRQSF